MSTAPKIIKIDVDAVLRQRLPRYYRFIPRWLISRLKRFVCQDEMNLMLEQNAGRRGADFCRGVIDHLNISYRVDGQENLPANPRVIIVCNHPLGGLDGMILIDYVTRHYGRPVRFLVNDLLMAIHPLDEVFLPVNKHGRQSRQAADDIDRAMESDAPILIFPAGLVSRKGKNGEVADLQWKKMFVNRAIKHRRDVIPTYFCGKNSNFFYNFAKLRTRLGLKFNIEMIRLPREVFLCKGKSFRLSFGQPIPWQSLRGGQDAESQSLEIRRMAYSLANNEPTDNSPC